MDSQEVVIGADGVRRGEEEVIVEEVDGVVDEVGSLGSKVVPRL